MIANYHTHTTRCFHAKGTDEEFIQAALEAGLDTLGFSDHAPQPFPGDYYSTMRMYPEMLTEYVQSISALREQYKDRLNIHIGLEAEYYPALFPTLLQWVRDTGVEYLILGQHWLGNEQDETHIMQPFEEEARLARYCDQVIEALDTGAFTYIAHPDLPNFVGDRAAYDRQMRRLIRHAKSCDTPLEINLLGLRAKRNYPNPHFWELVAEENCPAILGKDAHRLDDFQLTNLEQAAQDMAQKLGLLLLDRVTLKKP